MALVLPVFVMVVMGIIEFGRAMMVSQLVTNAARIGARRSIIEGSSNSQVEQAVKDFCATAIGVDPGDVLVTIGITPLPGNDDSGNDVGNAQMGDLCTVTVSIPFDKVAYVTGQYLANKSLTASCSMQLE